MRESTFSWIGNFEEKIDLSHIYLAVQIASKFGNLSALLISYRKALSETVTSNTYIILSFSIGTVDTF